MAALGILESILGFDQTQLALMITLYVATDSIGTACNITGDGAIALVVNRIMPDQRYHMPSAFATEVESSLRESASASSAAPSGASPSARSSLS